MLDGWTVKDLERAIRDAKYDIASLQKRLARYETQLEQLKRSREVIERGMRWRR